MANALERQTTELVDHFMAGRMSRRVFIARLLALGLSAGVAGAILANVQRARGQVGSDVAGNVRFLIGPWTADEVANHETIAAAFKELYPNVTFSFTLFDWGTSAAAQDASLIEGAHDIYYFGEGGYVNRQQQETDNFEDITARINDPAFADEKAKYLYWDRIEAYGPKLIGLPISWHVEDALFVNNEALAEAGYGPEFVESWDSFVDAVGKMTKGTDTYGAGIGMQIGHFAEWYQMSPRRRRHLPDPRHVGSQRQQARGGRDHPGHCRPVHAGVCAADRHLRLQHGSRRVRGRQARDLLVGPHHRRGAGHQGRPLRVVDPALAARPRQPAVVQRHRLLRDELQDARQGPRLGGAQALDERGPGRLLDRQVRHLLRREPTRSTTATATTRRPQLAAAFDQFQELGVGPEPFAEWGTVESQAAEQAARAYIGEIPAEEAITEHRADRPGGGVRLIERETGDLACPLLITVPTVPSG